MSERTSPAQRVRMQHVAEREIQRYAGDHAAWHKHVHDVELDPMQVLKCVEMDRHLNTIDFSCRRTGKTAVKELYGLYWNATHSDQEWGIVAPREAQSLNNLGYHLEAIRRSPILPHFIAWKGGRKRMSDTQYEFANRSRAVAYGIMAQVDGGDLTAASLEETDDMPADRLYSNFLLMLGSTRRLGAAEDAVRQPCGHIGPAAPRVRGQGGVLGGLRGDLGHGQPVRDLGQIAEDRFRVGAIGVLLGQFGERTGRVARHDRLEQVEHPAPVGQPQHGAHLLGAGRP